MIFLHWIKPVCDALMRDLSHALQMNQVGGKTEAEMLSLKPPSLKNVTFCTRITTLIPSLIRLISSDII